jgi:hypothetical protein
LKEEPPVLANALADPAVKKAVERVKTPPTAMAARRARGSKRRRLLGLMALETNTVEHSFD